MIGRKGDIIEGIFLLSFLAFILLVISVLGAALFVNSVGATRGTHTGYITAVEHRDNLIWPADILYFKTDGQSSQEDIYCINPEIMDLAREYQKNKTLVTITYSNDILLWVWECNGGSTIVENIENG